MPKLGHYVHRQETPSQIWEFDPSEYMTEAGHTWVYSNGPSYTYSLIFDESKVIVEFSDGPATGTVVMMTDEFLDRTIVKEECEIIEKERALDRAVQRAENLLTKHSTR